MATQFAITVFLQVHDFTFLCFEPRRVGGGCYMVGHRLSCGDLTEEAKGVIMQAVSPYSGFKKEQAR